MAIVFGYSRQAALNIYPVFAPPGVAMSELIAKTHIRNVWHVHCLGNHRLWQDVDIICFN